MRGTTSDREQPHVAATALRFWHLRTHVDRRVLVSFGVMSAAGGLAGGVSGLFGGLVGNQGGIRSAALLGFDVDKQAFVATATAIGLVVDAARMPVHFATQPRELAHIWAPILIATLGALAGTLLGMRLVWGIPERAFRGVVAVVLLALGIYMAVGGGG